MPTPFQRRPGAQLRPSFSRDFAGLKTLDHGVGPAITFTRASDATFFDASGTLQTASNDVARFDHSGGSSLGLLIEEARTNLLERSAEINQSPWGGSSVTVSADAGTSPAGTTAADAILETVDNGVHERRQSVSIATTGNHTYSVFLKANGRNFASLRIREAFNSGTSYALSVFDLANGTVASTQLGTATIQSVGNGWYRCTVTGTVDSGSGRTAFIRLTEDGTNFTYAGDITKGVLAWGAQLEAGAFPTSYIPTTTAAATRSADVGEITPVSSFYNAVEGTMFCEFVFAGLSDGTIWGFDNSSHTQRIFQFVNTSSIPTTIVTQSGVTRADLEVGSAVTAGQVNRFIAALKVDDYQAARNGTLGTPDTSGAFPTGIDRLRFGRRRLSGGDTGFYNGHIRKVAYWPKRLTNTLLEQLTT
jgi:hypothetical protein